MIQAFQAILGTQGDVVTSSIAEVFIAQGVSGAIILVLGLVVRHLYKQVSDLQSKLVETLREQMKADNENIRAFEKVTELLKAGKA